MFRILVLYQVGVRVGYIQLQLTDYIGNDGVLKTIQDIRQYYREHFNTLPVYAEERKRRMQYRMNRYEESNSNIIIRLEDLLERGIENPILNIRDLSRIDPEIKPTQRDFEFFMDSHPNDRYFLLTIPPRIFLYYLYSTINRITNRGEFPLIPFQIQEFDRDMNPKRPDIPINFGYSIIKRQDKHILMPHQGTAKFFKDIQWYAKEKRTIENFIRVNEDCILRNVFAKNLEEPLIGKFHCLRNFNDELDVILNPHTILIKSAFYKIFENNEGYFDKSMIKSYRSLAQRRAKTFTFEDLLKYNIPKYLHEIYQQYNEFKGDIATLYKIIDPLIREFMLHHASEIPKGMDFREYVFLMILYRTLNATSFNHFEMLLSFINPEILHQFSISSDHRISIRKLINYHSNVPYTVWRGLFDAVTGVLAKNKIISSSILVGDGTFVHSFASDYKNPRTHTYNDSSAAFTVHSDKIYGLGFYFTVISAYHEDRIIPIHVEVYPGSIHESKMLSMIYPKIYEKCQRWSINAKYLIYDGGAYSPLNFDLGYAFGIQLISPVGLRGSEDNLFKAGRFSHYSVNDMPDGFGTALIEKCLRKRGHSESIFSFLSNFYGLNRIRSHSFSGVLKEIFLSMFLLNAKNFCAGLLNRSDLFGSPTAFSQAPLSK